MKWRTISKREIDITWPTGTKVYLLDKKPTAAKVVTSHTTTVAMTNRELSPDDQRLVSMWLESQPNAVRHISDHQLEKIIDGEGQRSNDKSTPNT
jgi:hypothetical protein